MNSFYKKEVDVDGNIFYLNKKGQYHREDGPAIEWNDGDREWRVKGYLHRTDGPAVEFKQGFISFFINGKPIDKILFHYLTKYTELYTYQL